MSVGTNDTNIGLISQNYEVINRVNQTYGGSTAKELD